MNYFEILLVEDDPAEVRLTREAVSECDRPIRLHVATDGDSALDYLHQRDGLAVSPRPNVILLDLDLPGKDGHHVLREIKADPALRRIPVVVLTTSSAIEDVQRAYDAYANCYIRKPADLDTFVDVIRMIHSLWLGNAAVAR